MGKLLGVILAVLLASSIASALEDTRVDYTPYREIVPGEAGVVYEIRITNTGARDRTYEIVPGQAVRDLGTYRIDPWHTITLSPDEQGTAYLYITLSNGDFGRKELPVKIVSGNSSVDITMVARPVGPFIEEKADNAVRNLLAAILIIIIILAIIYLFTRRKKKDDTKVETYY